MSRRTRAIVGPQSALTDYLASHNISARQIADEHQARVAAALAAEQAEKAQSAAPVTLTVIPTVESKETIRKKEEQKKAIEKIKQTKKFKKRKRDADSDEDDDDIAQALFEAANVSLPGQMSNCARCRKRFTVTPYSRANPEGGLLCTPCSKDLDAEDGVHKAKKKKKAKVSQGPIGNRRKTANAILDGTYHLGAKNLVTLCLEQLIKNIELAHDLGSLPSNIVDKIARMLSKRRLIDPRTVNLFLKPSVETVHVYDAARLSSDDFIRIFQTVSGLKRLKIRNGIQFKDVVMGFLLTRDINLESLDLHGANLLSDVMWTEFLAQKGQHLKSLKVSWTDRHVTDALIESVKKFAPSLQRLKIGHNQQATGEGIRQLGGLKKLEHLSLHLHKTVHSDVYVNLLGDIGGKLKTLSLSVVECADNTVLSAIHSNCQSLKKLRITESGAMTDDGFVRLFKDWANPPLEFVDFEKCRHLDSYRPRHNPDGVGFCSKGFLALMKHSRGSLRHLNLVSCRHISRDAFEEAFGPDVEYPELTELLLSGCEEVTDFILGSIFRSCPKLFKVVVFGCMKVKGIRVPRGKILVGVPNAMGMEIEGSDDDDDDDDDNDDDDDDDV